MKMQQHAEYTESKSLWRWTSEAAGLSRKRIWSLDREIDLNKLRSSSTISVPLLSLRGRSVLILTQSQLTAALALIELDGIARRLVLSPPDLPKSHLQWVISAASVDLILRDCTPTQVDAFDVESIVLTPETFTLAERRPEGNEQTEWLLLTSGTTGLPKIVVHTLSTLTGAITAGTKLGRDAIWATFYDIRRYGGLQIFLRAMLGSGSMVLSDSRETTAAFLDRASKCGVTHISGTPSHWRRALMCRSASRFSPRYIRLSGEIADQTILNNLRNAFPQADVAHAFASTEGGLAFEVTDGQAGFPENIVGRQDGPVETKVLDGTLRVRSRRTALSYIAEPPRPISDPDGFVDTNDLVELRDQRYYFVGRRDGVINVGGLKVHPEEIEKIVNLHPEVRMCRVEAKKNPIAGSVVAVDVVADTSGEDSQHDQDRLKKEIMKICLDNLDRHKVPAAIRFVPSLEIGASGKLNR